MGRGTKEAVDQTLYGSIDNVDPETWPSGELYLEMLQNCGVSVDPDEARFFQTSARWALLARFAPNLSNLPTPDQVYQRKNGKKSVEFSEDQINSIQDCWKSLLASGAGERNDLVEFLRNGRSNNRRLEWSVFQCAPACRFALHAHPNLELVYCARGALHGIRMEGDPLPIPTSPLDTTSDGDASANPTIKGPNLTQLNRPWFFETLEEGTWLANEVGSIHQSFTSTSGEGATLITLWGGAHANIADEEQPRRVSILGAVDKMDEKLKTCQVCMGGDNNWERIAETFLPESEKSGRGDGGGTS